MEWKFFLKIGTHISLVKLTFKETHSVQKSLFQNLVQLASETQQKIQVEVSSFRLGNSVSHSCSGSLRVISTAF